MVVIKITCSNQLNSAKNISKDENPLHSKEEAAESFRQLYLQKTGIDIGPGLIHEGVRSIGLLKNKKIEEFANNYFLGLEADMKSPLAIPNNEEGVEVEYTSKLLYETPFLAHQVEAREKKSNRLFLKVLIHSTPLREVFQLESSKNLEKIMEKKMNLQKIADLDYGSEYIPMWCDNLEIDEKEYRTKYGDRIAAEPASYKTAGVLIGKLKNAGAKNYVYLRHVMKVCSESISNKGIELLGNIPENLSQKTRCGFDMIIQNEEGILARVYTMARAL